MKPVGNNISFFYLLTSQIIHGVYRFDQMERNGQISLYVYRSPARCPYDVRLSVCLAARF